MKNAHRRAHLVLWLALTPIIAATIWFAIAKRVDAPRNDALPVGLIVEPV